MYLSFNSPKVEIIPYFVADNLINTHFYLVKRAIFTIEKFYINTIVIGIYTCNHLILNVDVCTYYVASVHNQEQIYLTFPTLLLDIITTFNTKIHTVGKV